MAHTLVGIVTSDKRDKTITVSITSRETHPLYRKQYTKTRKYTAHDAKNEARVGDKVEITACRPLSKTKAYTLVKIIERSRGSVELKENVLVAPIEATNATSHETSESSISSKTRHDGRNQTKPKQVQPATTVKPAVSKEGEQ